MVMRSRSRGGAAVEGGPAPRSPKMAAERDRNVSASDEAAITLGEHPLSSVHLAHE